MELKIDLPRVESVIEDFAKENMTKIVQEEVERQIGLVAKGIIDKIVNERIENYLNNYFDNSIIKIGNGWSREPIKEYTVSDYIQKLVNDSINNKSLNNKTFEEFLSSKVDAKLMNINDQAQRSINRFADNLKNDVNNNIKQQLTDATRQALGDSIMTLMSSNHTFKKIEEGIDLLGKDRG